MNLTEMIFIWAVITSAGMFVLTLLKLYFKFLRNDVTDNLNKFNLVSKYQMFIKKNQDK